jgi:hypothetical protein
VHIFRLIPDVCPVLTDIGADGIRELCNNFGGVGEPDRPYLRLMSERR